MVIGALNDVKQIRSGHFAISFSAVMNLRTFVDRWFRIPYFLHNCIRKGYFRKLTHDKCTLRIRELMLKLFEKAQVLLPARQMHAKQAEFALWPGPLL